MYFKCEFVVKYMDQYTGYSDITTESVQNKNPRYEYIKAIEKRRVYEKNSKQKYNVTYFLEVWNTLSLHWPKVMHTSQYLQTEFIIIVGRMPILKSCFSSVLQFHNIR